MTHDSVSCPRFGRRLLGAGSPHPARAVRPPIRALGTRIDVANVAEWLDLSEDAPYDPDEGSPFHDRARTWVVAAPNRPGASGPPADAHRLRPHGFTSISWDALFAPLTCAQLISSRGARSRRCRTGCERSGRGIRG